ncbi:MAG TPA: BON domain-containing protein [Thermoanaerobaculia bacterium]|nr:BON domain-containing protein [Thermoanaerobaculia bacterium]
MATSKKMKRQVAITAAFLVPLAVAAVLLIPRHAGQTTSTTHARADMVGAAPPTVDEITRGLAEKGVQTSGLTIAVVDDIVVIRGTVFAPEEVGRITTIAKQIGANRVANLVQTQQRPDDILIKQQAERELMLSRALQGCRFHVQSEEGVLRVNATVQSDLQEDAARAILRHVRGTQKVEAQFARF